MTSLRADLVWLQLPIAIFALKAAFVLTIVCLVLLVLPASVAPTGKKTADEKDGEAETRVSTIVYGAVFGLGMPMFLLAPTFEGPGAWRQLLQHLTESLGGLLLLLMIFPMPGIFLAPVFRFWRRGLSTLYRFVRAVVVPAKASIPS
jgi:hypothetical protein